MIDKFDGEYAFLSNYYSLDPRYYLTDGQFQYPTVEHFFQAQKATSYTEKMLIASAPTPGKAKRLGRRCQMIKNWEDIKDDVMEVALRQKFKDPELREKLLETGNELLVEGTTWHDRYWGVCNCYEHRGQGKNVLGRLLMKLRAEFGGAEFEDTQEWYDVWNI